MSSNVYYIIEHPTKGIMRDVYMEYPNGIQTPVPRYSWTKRHDKSKAFPIPHLFDALKLVEELEKHDRSRRPKQLLILKAPDWVVRCRNCRQWITVTRSGNEFGHRTTCITRIY